MTGLTDRVVGHDEQDQVLHTIVRELMRLVGWEQECVTPADGGRSVFVSDEATAGQDVIELPLGAVRVVGVGALARGNATDLHVEWMALGDVRRVPDASECLRNLPAGALERPLGRGPRQLLDVVRVDF